MEPIYKEHSYYITISAKSKGQSGIYAFFSAGFLRLKASANALSFKLGV